MNNFLRLRIFTYLVIVILANNILIAQDKSVKSLNYYELIGLDYSQLHKEALDAVNSNQEYIDARNAWQAIAQANKKAAVQDNKNVDAAAKKKDKIREQIESKFFANKIKPACEQARKDYKEQLENAQKEIDIAEESERKEKFEAFTAVQKKLLLTTTACPLLLDTAKRRVYDERLMHPQDTFSDSYFQEIQRGVEDAMLLAPDKKVIINEIIGDLLSQIEIPGSALKIFNQDLAIRSISFLPRPSGPEVRFGIGFTGLIAINKFEVRLSVYIVQDIYGSRKFSFITELPQTYRISDLFPDFKGFDAFKFPQAKFIIANFEGSDQDGFTFKKGFNFGALLDLSGPLKVLGELKDKTKNLKSLVFESKPIIMSGVIQLDISQSEFTAKVPLYIGVDLRKIDAIPKTLSDVINKITTDDFTLTISPVKRAKKIDEETGELKAVKPSIQILKVKHEPEVEIWKEVPTIGQYAEGIEGEEHFAYKKGTVEKIASIPFGFKVEAETGIRITLGTQVAPISLNIFGFVIPISKDHPEGLLSVGGGLKGMLQLKWLALGETFIDVDFDGALMPVAASFGIPFTGIGIRGRLDLGKQGDARAILKAAGGFRVAASAVPVDLMFELSGENIRFADLVSYSTKLATQAKLMKAPIPVERIPTMTLHKVWGYCALKETTIAGKVYRGGIGLQVETELFDYKAGFRVFMNDKFKLNGWGYIPSINFKVKGTEVFQLYGLTPDKGARLSFNFDPEQPLKGSFGLQGTVFIPALGLKQKADLNWRGYIIDVDLETAFPGFSVLFGIRMNTRAGMEMVSLYDEIKREVEKLLSRAGTNSAEARAAKKFIDEATKLEGEKRYQEAVNRLEQAKALLSGTTTEMIETKTPGMAATQDAESHVIEMEARVKTAKADVDILMQKAKTLQKQTAPTQQLINQATIEYGQYSNPERWNAIYNRAHADLLAKASKKPPVTEQEMRLVDTGAKRVVAVEKTKKLQSIVDRLAKARTWLESALEEEADLKSTGVDYLTKKHEEETDPSAKWSKLYVKFGFKGDFAKFINEQAVPTLRTIKENAGKKLDQLTEKIAALQVQAVGSVEQEVNRVKSEIAAKEKEISTLQTQCSTFPLYKQTKCRATIAAQKAVVASKQAYLNALLKPGRAVVKGVTKAATSAANQLAQGKALRRATEAVLEGAMTGLELLATGINFFNITEARGEYSWEDMITFKLPKLVRLIAKLELPGAPMEIVLENLQFDFKNPKRSAAEITRTIMSSFIEGQQSKYLKYATQLAS